MAAASEASSSGNGFLSFANNILGIAGSAWGSYNQTQQSYAQAKAEQAKADAAEKNYQSSLNFAGMEKSKIVMVAIAVVGAIIGLFLIFRK